jgi:hypothetical protein
MELSNSSLEQLVKEIVAVNHGWKLACNLFEQTSSLATSLRDLKTCKQIRLLQAYGTTQVYLAIDPAESPEPLYPDFSQTLKKTGVETAKMYRW